MTPSVIGQPGGALGYSAANSSTVGLSHGYLGVGLDTFGNFSNKYEGSGCTDPPNIAQRMPGQVVVRGPGNGTVGYCALQSSAATATSPALTLRAATRAVSLVPVEVVYNPSSVSVTTPSGLVVPAGSYDVTFTPVGGAARTMVGALPVVPAGLYPASWVSASGFPKQLAFGWVGSTGSVTDFHEVDNVVVTTLNPVPQLAVSQTSYAAAVSQGSPVTYVVAASSSGAAENLPVTVTETLPAGVVPVGASGAGWVCAAPAGQQISCTNSTSPFSSGTITVNGVVTSGSVTQSLIQTATTAVASSGDASPATSSSAPSGTVPAAPNVTGVSPANGPSGGSNDVTVSGTNLGGATAIEIGTAAEFAAGTPATVVACAVSAPGCFTVTSGTSLDISSMPAHAAAAVIVRVVSLGIAGSGAYTYNPGPSLTFPAPPGGEVGVAYSDQLTVTGGTSPFTWSVSAGTLPPGLTLSASTGLLSGTPAAAGVTSFTVKVTDHAGLTATEPVTLTVIPGPSLNFPDPPGGWTHTVYSDTLTESGGTSPFAWTVSAGSLPAGIILSPDGTLTGTPTATGTFPFTVKVTDANGQSATQATSITIAAGVTATFPAPPNGVVGTAYSDTLTATGGTTPYTWSVNAGSLPPGLALTAAGVLSGTPTTAGSYAFSVNVIDKNGGISTTSVVLIVSASVTFTFAAPPGGQVGVAYSDPLTAAGGTTPYTWSVSAGSLPPGLTLSSSTGVVSGTPAAGGTFSFTVKVTDAAGKTATQPTSITIVAAKLAIAASANVGSTTPGGKVSYTVTVTNTGQTAYTGATFTDPLGDVLDDAAYNGDAAATAGSVAFSSPNLTWTGNLAVGASATVTFSVTVASPDTGSKVLTSTITSATAGSNCAAGSGDAGCTTTVNVAVLTIVNSSGVSTTTPGSAVRFTATFTNAGKVPYTGITIATNASDVFDDATPNGDQTATSGTLSITGSGVSWTGDIPVGATVTVTGTVTVKNPDTGNKVLASTIATAAAGSNCPAGGTDPACSVSVAVQVPGLTLSQSADVTFAVPGQRVTFTVTIANTGQTAYAGATVTNTLHDLDDGVYNNDASATAGTVSYASPVLTWTGNLAPGAQAVITYTLTVNNPDTGDKLLSAELASASVGSNCPVAGSGAACTITIPVLTPALTIVKTASSPTAVPGQVVTYTITVTNSGQTPYAPAAITDPLGGVLDDAAYNGDAAATAGSVTFSSPALTWTGNLPPGAAATITYSVTVANPDTGDKSLANTVTSPNPGSNCPAGAGDSRCTATVAVVSSDTLTFTQTTDAASAVAGDVVHYTITVANTGLTPYAGAALTDPLAGVLDDATWNNDAAATSGTLAFTSPDLTWTGTVPAAGTVTIRFSVTVKNPDTGNKILAAAITSASPGSNCLAGTADARCTATVTISQLAIVNSSNVTTTTPGATVRFTVTLTNSGQTPYTGITVNASTAGVFDDANPNGDQTATSGTLSLSAGFIAWTGDIPPGGTVTITGTVDVHDPDTGNKVLASTVSTAAPGSNCPVSGGTDPACSVAVAVQIPGLTLTKTADVAFAVPGQTVRFTVTIADTGQTAYTPATVTDTLNLLDDATYNNNATASTGAVSYASPVLTWTGNLSPGDTAVITYTVTVHNPDTGDKLLTGPVASTDPGSSCPPASSNAGCDITIPVLTPALTISIGASPATATPGTAVAYTITAANTGQTPYAPARVTDSLAGVLGDATYGNDATATAGTVTYASPVLTWTGNLAPGATATITYTVTVSNPDTGGRTLTTAAVSQDQGSNCPAASTDPRCAVTVNVIAGALTITVPASADLGSAAPGGTISAPLGVIQVTDNRGFGANWATTVSAIEFSTGSGTPLETIPVSDASYTISSPLQTTGSATFTATAATTLSGTPQPVVSATSVQGNTTATWNPLIEVHVPASAVAGPYTSTITHSVL
ncbi:MAG TPA: putative Ig domain-containing protein [Nakamurella sp.]